MSYNLLWIFFLIIQAFAASFPMQNQFDSRVGGIGPETAVSSRNVQAYEDTSNSQNEKVISVRITSSVAVGRGRSKSTSLPASVAPDYGFKESSHNPAKAQPSLVSTTEDSTPMSSTDVPPNLIGANIEYIKQLNAKKELKEHSTEPVHPFQFTINSQQTSEDEPFYEESTDKLDEYDEEAKNVPLARKIPSTADANQFHEHKINNKPVLSPDKNFPLEMNAQDESIKLSDLLDDSINMNQSKMDNEDNKHEGNSTALPMTEQHTERRDINKLTPDGTQLLNNNYQSDDSIAESSIKSVEFAKNEEVIGNIPQTGTIPLPGPSQNYIRDRRPLNEGRSRLTTVSFNIVHDNPKTTSTSNEPSDPYTQGPAVASQQHFYDPPTIYSQPAQIYSEPAKFYSEPAKVYSEPAKIYSEPAKVYSEPAKIYSEPAKFYSEPASLHLHQNVPPRDPNNSPWQPRSRRPITGATVNTTPLTTAAATAKLARTQMEHQPEKNYEVDEKVSVLTDGRSHGVQETTTEKCKQDNCKVGYVVEGRQYKKYRVEERTSDGFIVGEYGVVRNEDGALRGVRYTADSDASPGLIQDALMKFLQLK